jgi:hypothetical protein
MCMIDQHRVLRAISLGAAWPAKAYKYQFAPVSTLPTVSFGVGAYKRPVRADPSFGR